ncbi:hypothetical protein C9374_014399 [Naegleria lovaniensis]|uniref:F-box domain-containing protein n=1 Tax=Naegleria lovaniensis TaxID=51637 RepID=A0AA88H0F2_NAELO|nr:uncharacterized protein C9374_014399 [Naegleria lovaniensis]KAG2388999.1 hypothetical protein C9374_014399 [Naegleria lovaniensis]
MKIHELPPEIIISISSYVCHPFSLSQSVLTFRHVCKAWYALTDGEDISFWRELIQVQLQENELHSWLHDLLYRTRRENTFKCIHEEVDDYNMDEGDTRGFVGVVNGWIDLFASDDNYANNKLLRFLLFIALGGDTLQYFGRKRVAPSIQHYFLRMFQPMLEEMRSMQQHAETKDIIEKPLLNMNMIEFLQDHSLTDYSVCYHWIQMDDFKSIIPRQYFIMALEYFSAKKIVTLSSHTWDEYAKQESTYPSNQPVNAALWIMQHLNEVGIPVCHMLFYDGFHNRNFNRAESNLIPRVSNCFTLQFLALWANNLDVVKWCLEHRSLQLTNPIDSLLVSQQSSDHSQVNIEWNADTQNQYYEREEQKQLSHIVSAYSMSSIVDALGLTILHYAVRMKQLETVKCLLNDFKANPFIRSTNIFNISPLYLSHLMVKRHANDTVYQEIFALFEQTFGSQFVQAHLQTVNNECGDCTEQLINLDEVEQEDKEKLDFEKGPNTVPIHMKHSTVFREPYDTIRSNIFNEESDECEEEEFLSEEYLQEVVRNANDLPKSGDPYFDEQFAEEHAYLNLENALSLTESIETKEHLYSMTYHHKITLRNRTSLNEEYENKKRKLSEFHNETQNNLETGKNQFKKRKIQPFKSRRDMVNPKLLFKRVVNDITNDYKSDAYYTPGALSLLQQVSENTVVELSKLACEISNFFMLNTNDVITENEFKCGHILYFGGKPLSNIKLQLSDLQEHLIALKFICDNTTAMNELLKRMHGELEFLSFCDEDCDYYMEEDHAENEENISIEQCSDCRSDSDSECSDISDVGFEIWDDGSYLTFYHSTPLHEMLSNEKLTQQTLSDGTELFLESIDQYDSDDDEDSSYGYLIYTFDKFLMKTAMLSEFDTTFRCMISSDLFYV